ncbi:unnamed protein product, partial [Vitis vinifera]|uniref:Uncharacterized protein n=1 Tax=Vitis vinifera TaxID=29760 RepID=D7TF85_VITVI
MGTIAMGEYKDGGMVGVGLMDGNNTGDGGVYSKDILGTILTISQISIFSEFLFIDLIFYEIDRPLTVQEYVELGMSGSTFLSFALKKVLMLLTRTVDRICHLILDTFSNNLLHNIHIMYRNAVQLIPKKEMTNYSSCSSFATNGPNCLRDMEID